MKWTYIIDFFKPTWKKGFVLLLFSTLYLLLSYVILAVWTSSSMAIYGSCIYSMYVVQGEVNQNICDSECVTEKYYDLLEHANETETARIGFVKVFEPVMLILSPITGTRIGELMYAPKLFIVPLYWYTMSCVIMLVYNKLKKI